MAPRQDTFRKLAFASVWATLSGAGAACAVDVEIGRNAETIRSVVLDVPARKPAKLDLLFVVDSSSEMAARHARVAESFEHLVEALRHEGGELPDLHIGVITSDLGAGVHAESNGCTPTGDAGALLAPEACGVDGTFLTIGSQRNFTGDLGDAFACISSVGESGCDYEQPLEAMRRALSGEVAGNEGFLRASAALGVVFISDEDDCSSRGDALFDPNHPALVGDAEWRCFSRGVRCGNDDDVFPPGWQADCVAREDSTFVTGIDAYADFVRSLKSDPATVVATGVVGDPTIVRVGMSESAPVLEPACGDPSGLYAFPAVRLHRFFEAARADAPIDATYSSLCRRDSTLGVLENAANRLRMTMGSRCLRGPILDIDGDTPGPQVDCVVSEVYPDRESTLRACDHRFDPARSSFFPCFTIEPGNDQCNHEPTRLSLRVVRSALPDPRGLDAPLDARLRVDCVVDDRDVIVVK